MGSASRIEWTDSTWNPVTGCTKISNGCANCYAERMAKRLKAMGNIRYVNGFDVTLHEDLISAPKKWRKPRLIFVNSMSDLFHEDVPEDFVFKVFSTMNETPRHTYQILTKRSGRLLRMAPKLSWSENVWMGVSVEDKTVLERIAHLKQVRSKIRFLSFEPLIAPLGKLDLHGIHWVIVGGESGPGARPIKIEWVRHIRDQCIKQKVPFFFKQWGGVRKHETGRTLDGEIWDEYPKGYEEGVIERK